MEIQVILSLLGIISGVIGLLTAIAGRKKIIENRHVTVYETRNSGSSNKKWYDNHFYVFLAVLFFYPLGAYALVQSNNISTFWKAVWIPIGLLWFIGVIANGG